MTNAHDNRTLEERLQWIADWSEPGIDLADAGTAREALDKLRAQAAEIERLRAQSDWQPMETAPKDIELLVLRRDKAMHVARVGGYDRRYGILSADFGNASCSFFFPVGDNSDDDDAPTHWMPLPAAPTEGEG